jgi:hypothetical protein
MIEGSASCRVLIEILSRHPEWEQAQILGVLFPHPAAAPDEQRPSRQSTPLPRRGAGGGFIKVAIKRQEIKYP